MNVFKRAGLYALRSPGRSLLLAAILLAAAWLALCGLSLLRASEEAAAQLRGATGASFTVERNLSTGSMTSMGGGMSIIQQEFLTDAMLEKIGGVQGVKACSARNEAYFDLRDQEGSSLQMIYSSPKWDATDLDYTARVVGSTSTEYEEMFISQRFQLVQGRHLAGGDERGILVSEGLAQKHGLSVGDPMELYRKNWTTGSANAGDKGEPVEIAGIFRVNEAQDDKASLPPSDVYENWVFAPMKVVQSLSDWVSEEEQQGYQYADFFVEDPAQLEDVIRRVRQLEGINWENFLVSANDETFQRVSGSMSNASRLLCALIGAVALVSGAVVALVLSLWLRGRLRETGVLLAMGVGKGALVLQHLLEAALAAAPAFCGAWLLSGAAAGPLATLFAGELPPGSAAVTAGDLCWVLGGGGVPLLRAGVPLQAQGNPLHDGVKGGAAMHWLKRAALHCARKRGKTLLLFCILLALGALLLCCLSIRRASAGAALNVRQSLRGAFTIDAKAAGGQLTLEVVDSIRQLEGVVGYNGRSASYGELSREDGTPLSIRTDGAFDVVAGFEHAGKVVADSFTREDELFTEGGFVLTEGSHLTPETAHGALIHRWLAQENGLRVGDKLRLGLNGEMTADEAMGREPGALGEATVEVVGIFESTLPQEGAALFSHLFYENTVFIGHESYSRLFPQGDGAYCESARFQAGDPQQLDSLMEQTRALPGVDWDRCGFSKQAADYERARGALQALEQVAGALALVALGGSAGLLGLVFALWGRGRVHEAGVYLAMGVSKAGVVLQQVAEAWMTAVCAFALAAACGGLLAEPLGRALLQQAADPQALEGLSPLRVAVGPGDVLLLYAAGLLLTALSVAAAAAPLLRLKPKEILTKLR